MKLASIVIISTLIVLVNGNWLAAAAQPAMLGLSAIMVGLNEDEQPETDVLRFDWKGICDWKKWIPWIGKKEEVPEPKVQEKKKEKETQSPFIDTVAKDEKINTDNESKEIEKKKKSEKTVYNPN